MLYALADSLSEWISVFNVFHYISFRVIMSTLTALLGSLWLGPKLISWLKEKQLGQQVRDDGPQTHLKKSGTPTMGGILILLSISFSTLMWANLQNQYVWLVLFVLVSFGMIGFADDYTKISKKNSKGISSRQKIAWQSLFGLMAVGFLYATPSSPEQYDLLIPFMKEVAIPLGVFYIVFSYFVVIGTSNAVNLTDGLDGLAILPAVLVTGALGIFAYLSGHLEFADYLLIPYIPGAGELSVLCGAIVGAGLGFLWFNAYPAMIFMGDVGSLALGGAIGLLAVIVRQELVLFIMGGVFVMETLSVMLQVGSYKLRKKRIFKMAPLHHHFELSGWPEPRVIVRFWIMTVVLVLVGLATLKLR